VSAAARARLGGWGSQALAALAVAASGYASLGTTDCSDIKSLTVQREVPFGPEDASRLVRVRVSPSRFYSLEVMASADAEVVQIEPPTGSGGAGGNAGAPVASAGASAAGAGAAGAPWTVTGGTLVGLPSGGLDPSTGGTSSRWTIEYPGDGAVDTYVFRLDRGPRVGTFTSLVTVELGAWASWCSDWDDPTMDLRVELID